MSVRLFNNGEKASIVQDYQSIGTYAGVARKWNCSADTIKRVLQEQGPTIGSTQPTVSATNPQQASLKMMAQKAATKGTSFRTASANKAKAPKASVTPRASSNPRPESTGQTSKVLAWSVSAGHVVVYTDDGDSFSANNGHPNFTDIVVAVQNHDFETAKTLIDPAAHVKKYSKGDIEISDGLLTYKGLELDTGLTRRIIDAMNEGRPFEYMVNFLENLLKNVSRRAVHELFGFLQHNDIELTEDGHFLAWKRVSTSYKDMYTGKIDNSPGAVVQVERNEVDEDSDRTCSAGLHVAAKHYLPHYGGGRGVIIQVKVNPRDVVAIPQDYKNAKLRCCRYEVLKDVTVGFSHY